MVEHVLRIVEKLLDVVKDVESAVAEVVLEWNLRTPMGQLWA